MKKRQIRNRIKRASVILLAFILLAANTLSAFADEADEPSPDPVEVEQPSTEEPTEEEPTEEEPTEEEPTEEPTEEPSEVPSEGEEEKKEEEKKEEEKKEEEKKEEEKKEEEKTYKITIDNDSLSFGTITTSDSPRPLSFRIKNEGSEEVTLGWSQTETSGLFILNMPFNVSFPLESGQTVQGSVEIDKNKLATGDYSSTLLFTDLNHESSQVKATVSVRVEKVKPKVTKVRISPGSVSVRQGSSAEFKASVEGDNDPDPSVSWSVEGQTSGDTWIDNDGYLKVGENEDSGSFTVIAVSDLDSSCKDKAVVNVAKEKYAINTNVEPEDGGYANGGGTFSRGERTTLTAVANKGYKFKEWIEVGGEHVSSSASFTTDKIEGDHTYKALFKESGYEIKVKTSDKDKGSVEGGGFVDKGDDVTIKATPKKGYYFYGWYEKDKLVSRDQKLKVKNVKKDHTFVAEFTKDKYVVNVTASPADGGKVSGSGTFKKGESTVVKAVPASGYHFKGFVINNNVVSEKTEYKIKDIDRDISVTAFFEKDGAQTFTIKSGVANEGGAISPSGEISVTKGSSITYTIAPDNGYGILEVDVDGVKKGSISSFTFENVGKPHTIAVAFAPKKDPVNDVKMSQIISVEEAEAIAVAKLEKAAEGAEGQSSVIMTPEELKKLEEEERAQRESDSETLVVAAEQNLIGMDGTDELGDTVDSYNPDTAVGVYQSLDITRETAEKLIDGGGDAILINEAYELGYLDILINNEYMVPGGEGDLLTGNNTVHNLQEIVRAALTKEDKLKMLEGKEVILSFTISGAENPGDFEKEMMKGASGVNIDRYLYMTLMKTVDGETSLVEELDTPMELTMEIPEELRDKDKKFCIVRNHNGEIDVLEDQDDDPDTITIKTDRFSPYAMGHFSSFNVQGLIIGVAAAIAILLLITAIFVNALSTGKKKRNR